MEIVPPTLDEVTLRMGWPLICRLACQAHIHNVSMNALMTAAIQQYVDTHPITKRK